MKTALLFAILLPVSSFANDVYKLRITNGASMPISPSVVYTLNNHEALIKPGQAATPGFVKLCQTGNNDLRFDEVQKTPTVVALQKTSDLLFPGQSVELTVNVKETETLHFEAMYGKTKDACASFEVTGRELMSQDMYRGRDEVLSTGAFTDPMLPANTMSMMTCANAKTAIDCLRLLSSSAMGVVRFFPGYSPLMLSYLEKHYGAADVQTLIIPTSGAVRFEISHQ